MLALLPLLLAATDVQLIIYSGGKTRDAGDIVLNDVKAAAWLKRAKLSEGYPRVEESAKVPGLKPGFFVVTLGACGDEKGANAFLDKLRGEPMPAGVKPYARAVTDSRPAQCPSLIDTHELRAMECEAGTAASCYEAGLELSARRDALWRKGCELNDAHSCGALGDGIAGALQNGWDQPKGTPDEAARFLDKACQMKDPEACLKLGRLYDRECRENKDVREKLGADDAKAAAAYDKHCANQQDCLPLANLLAQGRGIAKDEALALKYFLAHCDKWEGQRAVQGQGFGGGCWGAAVAYAKGRGVKKDGARAKRLYARGCQQECSKCCEAIGEGRPDGD